MNIAQHIQFRASDLLNACFLVVEQEKLHGAFITWAPDKVTVVFSDGSSLVFKDDIYYAVEIGL